ncbi:biopolymer transporter ExbD [Acidithiobacillus sp.]|jgi:hypothetical protein|uniref:ExbD/TolR family protein n=1 Tax=Acidithiobacillus sp. TaxID=1872118 RepID=UPI0025BAE7AB|nr:biopolymer transporter ExbD [Acidithiobacillus sp.]MCK9188750.1 biopolymer transporter ExbD [Acidithiobacillus sp.]MCK9359708.1 biopolymer transporter ExbD [Acidithiobacillus sp.]
MERRYFERKKGRVEIIQHRKGWHGECEGPSLCFGRTTKMLANDGNPGKTQITIAADKVVPFQDFVDVMDVCQKAGVSEIGIAAKAAK